MSRYTKASFLNRAHAGAQLGELLASKGVGSDALVLGLLRGGIPVAAALADYLGATLGALAVRKLGVPGDPELAFGAVAAYGEHTGRYLVPSIHRQLCDSVPAAYLEEVEINADTELEALAARFSRYSPDPHGRTVVLCDDGLATGASMHAALAVLSTYTIEALIVAVPVAPRELSDPMPGAQSLLVLRTPRNFSSVAAHYEEFDQVDEQTVEALLRRAASGQR